VLQLAVVADEARRGLIDTLRRRRAGFCPPRKARERRPGGILAEAFVAGPRRVKPKGASSGWRAKHTRVARDS
jgi:hypothetical protein